MSSRVHPRNLVFVTAAVCLAACAPAWSRATLIQNVHGYTLVPAVAGSKIRRFDALVFEDGKVLATGRSRVLHQRYPEASIVDGLGGTLLPGLIDAHGHVNALGAMRSHVSLYDTISLSQAQDKIRDYGRTHPDRTWILGGGWNQVSWQLDRFPSAAELDAAIVDRPVVLSRVDGHAKWLNGLALSRAGITKDTVAPSGGRIERDADGNPSGILVDNAMELIDAVIPEPSDKERRAALQLALAELASVGLTSVGDAGVSARDVAFYKEFADQGRLTARIYAMIYDTGEDFETLSRQGQIIAYGDDHLTVRSVKLVADGALGSRGAAMLAPYSDAANEHGLLRIPPALIQNKIQTALAAGYQVNVHAIGDAANRQVLDAFAAAYPIVGGRELRNRIEHAQVVAVADIPRFKQLNLIASMQPTHATSDMNMAEDRIGPDRLKGAYAWHSFLAQGTKIAGGSDFPVESPNPFFGLYSAVTRMDHAGNPPGGWHPEQAMSLTEAFRAFTLDAAYAQHQENTLGSLEPGKWADFILIDRDLFKIAPREIWKIQVRQTWVGGKAVFEASGDSSQREL